MKKLLGCLLLLALSVAIPLTVGCVPALVGVGAAASGGGTYVYLNGTLTAEYQAPFEKVWEATERTVAEMHGTDVAPTKDISHGKIEAVIEGQKVIFKIDYHAKNVTKLAVRVGVLGDRLAAHRLHDKVGENLKKI